MNDIYTIFRRIHREGKVFRRLMGRFLRSGDHVIILEDHGVSELFPGGPMDHDASRRLDRLFSNPSFEIQRSSDNNINMEKVKPMEFEVQPPPKALPAPVFEYFMAGMDRPHVVEFKEDGTYLDGQLLTEQEVQHMLTKVQIGEATIAYKKHTINPSLVKSMAGQLEETVEPKKFDQKTLEEDSMVDGVANRFAYDNWSKQPHDGTFIMMDVNDLTKVNREIDPEAGDNVVKAVGAAMKEAYGKAKNDTSFLARITGDKFMAYFDDPKVAMSFAYDLYTKLDEIIPVNGTHKVSMGFGFGMSQEQAQQALAKAKERKYAIIMRNPDGSIDKAGSLNAHPNGTPNLNYSYLPGASNPPSTPMDDDGLIDTMFGDDTWPDNTSPPWTDEENKLNDDNVDGD